jgi:hypothetical protein
VSPQLIGATISPLDRLDRKPAKAKVQPKSQPKK